MPGAQEGETGAADEEFGNTPRYTETSNAELPYRFANPELRQIHYEQHGGEFLDRAWAQPGVSEEEAQLGYEADAADFIGRAQAGGENVKSFVATSGPSAGSTYYYDVDTGEFAVLGPDDYTIKTYMDPGKGDLNAGMRYWETQMDKYADPRYR